MRLVALTVILILGITYCRSERKRDVWNECSDKVHRELTEKRKDPKWDKGIKSLPFDILYHYILGKTYACVKNWK